MVDDRSGIEVDFDVVARLRPGSGFGALQNGQPDVDGVAVEDAGEAGGDDQGNAASKYGMSGWPTCRPNHQFGFLCKIR